MYADIHTHLLPNIDDGLRNKKSLFQIFSEYATCGISSIVFTPHLFNPYIYTDIPNIFSTYAFCRELAETFGIRCYLGSEIFIKDTEFVIEGIPIDGRFYLIEFPAMTPPSNSFLKKIERAQQMGYDIIIAHIERYAWLSWDSRIFQELQNRSVIFQCDADNITLQKAKAYLERDLIDIFATNNHGKTIDAPDKLVLAYNRYPSVAEKAEKLFI
ncbi:MAG: hypothetical protein LKE40_12035 [Spirochaetia bacterium]|jgi:protein-tyrosine phosphatase|nr:hypothetical protein [Spirochaetia bacterium]